MVVATAAAVRGRTITAGDLSIIPFQARRLDS
jgi:hypothetical protein